MKKRLRLRTAWVSSMVVVAAAAAYGCSGTTTESPESAGGGGATAHAGTGGGGKAGGGGGAVQTAGGTAGHSGAGGAGGASTAGAGGVSTEAGAGGVTNGGGEGHLTGGAGGVTNGGAGGSAGTPAGGAGADAGSAGETSAGAGGTASTQPSCSVPYGCTTVTCNAVPSAEPGTGEAGAGGASTGEAGATGVSGVVTTGTPAPGPQSGSVDGALAFTTTQDLVGADDRLPQGASPRTLSLWVESTTTGATFFNYGTYATNERFGLLSSGNNDYFVGENDDLSGTKPVSDGSWHHLAVTYDGTTITLYVDGVLDTSKAATLNTTGTNFAIGHTVGVDGREPFQGSISDIRVYDRALSAAEITSIASLSGSGANPETLRNSNSGLVFWLPLVSDANVTTNRCAP